MVDTIKLFLTVPCQGRFTNDRRQSFVVNLDAAASGKGLIQKFGFNLGRAGWYVTLTEYYLITLWTMESLASAETLLFAVPFFKVGPVRSAH